MRTGILTLPAARVESDTGIHHGTAMNIHEIDHAGRARTGLCFVPNAHLVAGDVMLAQKIALETDESGALRVARNFVPDNLMSLAP
jgi:hypothetical protein